MKIIKNTAGLKDKNGVVIEYGHSVEVPEPNDSDIHQHEFIGQVIGFRAGNVVVQDGD